MSKINTITIFFKGVLLKKSFFYSFFIVISLSVALSLVGCEGAAGPAGPQGTTGAQGTAGFNGATGATGKDGNANVKSQNVSVKASDWKWDATKKQYAVDLNVAAVTQAISDKGAVVCYRSNGNGAWIALPQVKFTQIDGKDVTILYDAIHSAGGVTVVYSYSDAGKAIDETAELGQTFKVVAIAASGLQQYPNAAYFPYEELKAKFNLPEESFMTIHPLSKF